MASWFCWPIFEHGIIAETRIELEHAGPAHELGDQARPGLASQSPLEIGDHGGDRRVGVLAGVVDDPARRGKHDVGQAPQLGRPDRRARPPRTSPEACGSWPARRRRPIVRSPPRRLRGNLVNRSGLGSARSTPHLDSRGFELSQRRGQRMQRLAARDEEQRPVEIQSLPAGRELAVDQEHLVELQGLLHQGELEQAAGELADERRRRGDQLVAATASLRRRRRAGARPGR